MGGVALAVLAVLLAGAADPGPDTVKPRGAAAVRGTISSITARQITISAAGPAPLVFERKDLESWTLGDSPAGLRDGDRAFEGREFGKAISGYRAALAEIEGGKMRPIHRPSVSLKLARAQRAAGDAASALDTLLALLADRSVFAVRADVVREAIAIGREKKDRTFLLGLLERIEKMAGAEAEIAVAEKARVLHEGGDAAGALRIVDDLLAKDPRGPAAEDALLLRIRCLDAVKDSAALMKICRSVLGAGPRYSPALIQAAGAVLAEVLLAATPQDPAALREALLASARAVSWGLPSRDVPPDDYARSLLAAARSYLAVAASAAAEAKAEHRRRATAYLREVIRSFPGTDWARRAEEALAGIGPEEKPGPAGTR